MNPKSISWLIPVGPNADSTWLAQALDSIKWCRHPAPHEIILVLDAYTGQCNPPEPDITSITFSSECLGVHESLNRGWPIAQYPLIARLDADDMNLPERLELQLPLIEDRDIVGGGLRVHNLNTDKTYDLAPNPITVDTIKQLKPICSGGTILIRKEALQRIQGWPLYKFAEDYALSCHLWCEKRWNAFANVQAPIIERRQHAGSVSAQNRQLQRNEAIRCLKDYKI